MKKNLKLWIASVAVAAIVFTGCSKEEKLINSSNASSEMSVPEIDVLANESDQEFVNFTISGGTETEGFSLENEGIPDAYQANENTVAEMNSAKRDLNSKRLRKCLSSLELSTEQIAKLRRLFASYEDCKSSIVKRYTHALRELTAKFNARHDELLKALRNGRISKEEFEKHMKALRIEFNRAQNHLALKSRSALKDCYHKMLRGMHSVLTERQWKAFVNCYRR